MNIKYITNVRVPTTRAQGYAIMKMCEEFSKAGADIELVVPNRRSNENTNDPFLYYGIKNRFSIKKLKSIDLLGPFEVFGKLFYWVDMLSFLVSVRISVKKFDGVFYTRDYLVALVLPKRSCVCLELHDIPSSKFLFLKSINKVSIFVVLNIYIKNELINMGVDESKILISPSGVDIEEFDIQISKIDARKKLNLPQDKKIVTYTGHFYEWKGVGTLADTAKMMPDILFMFIGGVEPDLTSFNNIYKDYKNIVVLPFIERNLIPYYLKASDILVLPNSAKENISRKYTSPLKMFEYMASGRPIVASKLSSILEVLNDSNSVLVEPDDSYSLMDAINKLLSSDMLSNSISNKARKDSVLYDWGSKAKKVLLHIKTN